MKTPKQLLIAARALIADREHWTQGYYAEDRDGASCEPNDDNAYCYCADGALHRALGIDPDDLPIYGTERLAYLGADRRLKNAAATLFATVNYIEVNDGEIGIPDDVEDDRALAHANILKVFDKAIADAEVAA